MRDPNFKHGPFYSLLAVIALKRHFWPKKLVCKVLVSAQGPLVLVLGLRVGGQGLTITPKTTPVCFGETYPLNKGLFLSGKIFVSTSEQFDKHHFGSADMR